MHPPRHRRLALLVAASLLAAGLPGGAPAVRAAAAGVTVDLSLGNGIASGAVVNPDPAHALVTATNGYHFWAGLDLQAPTGAAQLAPAALAVDARGVYGTLGLIGPGATSAWAGTFGSGGGSQAAWIHYDLATPRGAQALALTCLTIVADTFGSPLLAPSAAAVGHAVTLITDLAPFTDLLAAVQSNRPWAIAQAWSLLLQSGPGRAAILEALADLGVIATDAGLKALGSVVGLIHFAQTMVDLLRAGLGGHTSGQVTFAVAGGVTGTQATAEPTSMPSLQGTAPASAGNLGPWNVTVLSASKSTTPAAGEFPIASGYVRWTVTFAAKNVGDKLLQPAQFVQAGQDTGGGIFAVLRSDDGFVYPREPSGLAFRGAATVPPGFEVPATVILDAPAAKTALTLALTLDPTGTAACDQEPCEYDVPLAGLPASSGGSAYAPGPALSSESGLSQGTLQVAIKGSEIWFSCGMQGRWEMQVDADVTNNYGYAVWNRSSSFVVFDGSGNSWSLSPPNNGGGYPPGATESVGFSGDVGAFSEYCRDAPPEPRGPFYAVVVLGPVTDGSQDLADSAWGVFQLADPSLGAPVPSGIASPTNVPSDAYLRSEILTYAKQLSSGYDANGNGIPYLTKIGEVQVRAVGQHAIEVCVAGTGGTPSPRYMIFNLTDQMDFQAAGWHVASFDSGAGQVDTFPSMAACVSSIAGVPVR